MVRHKVYVEVCVMFDRDGNMTPISVTWENGTVYHVTKVIDVRRYDGECNGKDSMRYIVSIGKNRTELFYEDPAWFVECKNRRIKI